MGSPRDCDEPIKRENVARFSPLQFSSQLSGTSTKAYLVSDKAGEKKLGVVERLWLRGEKGTLSLIKCFALLQVIRLLVIVKKAN